MEKTEKKERSGSVTKVRGVFADGSLKTHGDVMQATGLLHTQVGMALVHLIKRKELEREQIERSGNLGRKKVWAYKRVTN